MTALALAALLSAQERILDWARALEEADLSWAWGPVDLELGGELDLELYLYDDEAPGVSVEDAALRSDHYKRPGQADGPEGVGRLKLTLDGAWGERISWFLEGRVDHGAPFQEGEAIGARLEQAWARASLLEDPDLNLQLGKFAAPLGGFIPRHHPKDNPLVTFPLPYDHITTFMRPLDTTAGVLARRDRPDVKDWRVPIYREVYGVGGMVSGRSGPAAWDFALMNSAPATWAFDWNLHAGDFRTPNVYARGTWDFGPTTTLGISGSQGPYSRDDADGIPAGRDAGDFPQTLAGVDLRWASGDLDVYAEAIWTRFEAPRVDDLELWSGYVEAKYTILPGLFGAGRIARMAFGEIDDAAGESRQWDRNTWRIELGGGYFFTRNLFLKVTGQLNRQSGGHDPDDDLLAFQLGLTF
jgi:hypothetical protein